MPNFSILSFNSWSPTGTRDFDFYRLCEALHTRHILHGIPISTKYKTFSWPEHHAVPNSTYHSHTWNGEEEGSDDDDEGQHLPCPFVPEHPVELVPETRQRRL